jgi:hypothetical protein
MAFENKEVLKTVLEAYEPNTDTRESCLGLSGLPLEFAFTANENLNYLSKIIPVFYTNHIGARKVIRNGDIVNKAYADLDWVIRFNLKLGELFEGNDFLKTLSFDFFHDTYFADTYDLMDVVVQDQLVQAGNEFFEIPNHKTYFGPMFKALNYFNTYFKPALSFIAHGVSISKDAPQQEVDAWKQTFELFHSYQARAIELGLVRP